MIAGIIKDQTIWSLLPVTPDHQGTRGGEPVTAFGIQGYLSNFYILIMLHAFDTILSELPGAVSLVSQYRIVSIRRLLEIDNSKKLALDLSLILYFVFLFPVPLLPPLCVCSVCGGVGGCGCV